MSEETRLEQARPRNPDFSLCFLLTAFLLRPRLLLFPRGKYAYSTLAEAGDAQAHVALELPTNPDHRYFSNRYHPDWHFGQCIRRRNHSNERATHLGKVSFPAPYGETIGVGILALRVAKYALLTPPPSRLLHRFGS